MAEDERRLEQLASAILDGRAIDWTAAGSDVDGAERELCLEMKIVAAIADVHRIPDSWGHLRLIERIGRGTFGDVYRAWDTRLDREVALKLLPLTPAAADPTASSFIHEGRLLARVRHNNVVTIYGAEQMDDSIGLWMEFVRGRTLEQILTSGTVFSAIEATRIGLDLCNAVSAVHTAGLLHRDIKAHNVILAHDGRVVLMDFGTGREVDDRSASDLAGTPLYVAPEVLAGKPATAQSDVYSLGVLLFHILCGSYPIQGRSVGDIRAAHDANSRTSLREARPGVPSRLAHIVERAVDPDLNLRYATAAEFGSALRGATTGFGRRRMLYVAAATSILLAAVGAWGRFERGAVTVAPRIAVLPFENRGSGSDSQELADGLTAEIQRHLAVIEGLALRSATSSFAFRNKARNLDEIGAQLGVDYVVEGSVARSNRELHITARFASVSGDVALWTRQFDRDARELPTILDEISLAIVNEMRVALGRGERRSSIDPDLYYQFLRARAFHERRGPENSATAAALFEQVIAGDPTYAPAWAGLASALAELSRTSLAGEMTPPDPRVETAALKALQLDPLLAEAHAAIGNKYARDRDWVNARMSFLKALNLNPSLTSTHIDFILGTLLPIGDREEALRQLDVARIVDPLSLDVRRIQALVFVESGRYTEAIENCRWIKQHDPAFPYVDVWLGRALYFSGRFDEAEEAITRAGPEFWGYRGYLLAISGRREEAEALAASHADDPSRTMLIYGGLGDRNRSFEALVRAAEVNWWRAATWLQRPEMAILGDDPRMPALRKKLGLPE